MDSHAVPDSTTDRSGAIGSLVEGEFFMSRPYVYRAAAVSVAIALGLLMLQSPHAQNAPGSTGARHVGEGCD